MRKNNSIFSRQFIMFLVAGGVAATVNFISRFYYNDIMAFGSAVVISYLTGMIVAFLLMRLFVFEKTKKRLKIEFFLFLLVNFFAILLTWGVSVGLAEYLFPVIEFNWHRFEIAHIVGISVPVFSSYFGHKYLTFGSVFTKSYK